MRRLWTLHRPDGYLRPGKPSLSLLLLARQPRGFNVECIIVVHSSIMMSRASPRTSIGVPQINAIGTKASINVLPGVLRSCCDP